MLFNYKGSKVEASSKEEAIEKVIAGNSYITVDEINQDNYKEYIGKKVNVTGNVYLYDLGLKNIPIIFGKVGGNFSCFDNKLTSLNGCPKEVNGDFDCNHNNLTSLKGSPSKVGEHFDCSNNKKEFTKKDVKRYCKVHGKICCD